ncbi:transposase [Luteimonas sp. RC10]|uniref:REP-associated tyrosine transposase n=1 Tax=Luteimonas sp. RC10 TaxID=2587035 RepID=UPI001618E1E6|nr:transposase [Luteimonas sp. RC10]MBB3345121.1 REP element-mobilizing transposase RayT [Luteimonas sp. RC10]
MPSPRPQPLPRSTQGTHYVVTAVTYGRVPWLHDPLYARIARHEIETCERQGWLRSEAWVLMPDRVHWLFELRVPMLGQVVQTFKSQTARAIRGRCRGAGSIWQAGFMDRRLRPDADLGDHVRELIAQPRRDGLDGRLRAHRHWWTRDTHAIAAL